MDDKTAIEFIGGLRALTVTGPEAEQACDIAIHAIETLAKVRGLAQGQSSAWALGTALRALLEQKP